MVLPQSAPRGKIVIFQQSNNDHSRILHLTFSIHLVILYKTWYTYLIQTHSLPQEVLP